MTIWKEKFDELNIDDSTVEEANSVREALRLKKDLEKHMSNISEEVKKAFNGFCKKSPTSIGGG